MFILFDIDENAKFYKGMARTPADSSQKVGVPFLEKVEDTEVKNVYLETLDGWKEAARPKTAGEIKQKMLQALAQVPDERVLEVHGVITSVNALLDLNRIEAAKLLLAQEQAGGGIDATPFLSIFNEGAN